MNKTFSLLGWIKANKILFAGGLMVSGVVVYGLYVYLQKEVPTPSLINIEKEQKRYGHGSANQEKLDSIKENKSKLK